MPAFHVPSVEERLRVSLVFINALHHLALLADEQSAVAVPDFTPARFPQWVGEVATTLRGQLEATNAALSAECLDAEAPVKGRAR